MTCFRRPRPKCRDVPAGRLYNGGVDFVVLSSSRGTTFQAVIEALQSGVLTARCLGLLTDSPDRLCLQKATAAKLPSAIVEKKPDEDRAAFDRRVDATLRTLIEQSGGDPGKTILAAMGWMWIMTPWLITRWQGRIINVHPALLPKYGGKGMYGDHVHKAVLAAGDAVSGITLHLMNEGVDTGEILLQKTCPVLPGETVASLKQKVQALEKEWYPKTLQMIETGECWLP